MSAINSDVIWLYSGTGVTGNTTGSIGGAITSNIITSGINDNLFPDVSVSDALAGITHFMCIYIQNVSSTTHTGIGIYFETNTPDNTASVIYLSPGTSPPNVAEQAVSSIIVEPVGVIWQNPAFSYTTVKLPDLSPGSYVAIWLKRQIISGCPGIISDFFRLRLISDQG